MDAFTLQKPFKGVYPITQTFAEHELRRKAKGWLYYNGGIDYGLPSGTAILAAAAGTVMEAQLDASGYGAYVKIRHANGSITLYGHNARLLVKASDVVTAGQQIALSDNTGNSTGPHLHFEYRSAQNVPVDPAPFLAQAAPAPVSPGAAGVSRVSTEMLRVRMAPSLAADVLGWLHQGDAVELCGEPVTADGVTWSQIRAYVAMVDQYGTRCVE